MGKGKKKVSFNPLFKVSNCSTSSSGIMANPHLLIDNGGDVEVMEVEELGKVCELNPIELSELEPEDAPKISEEMPSSEMNKSRGPSVKGIHSGKFIVNSFAEIVKNSRDPNEGFHLLFEENADEAVRILPEEIVDVGSKFGYALIGYFPTRHPGKIGMDKITSSWDVPVRVIPNVNGWITFIFKTARDRDIVLGGGPYSIFGRTLLLKTMPKWFKFGEDEIESVPTWVKLPNLPLECWNAKLISRIASKVGRPLMTDRMTTTMERISYARVLIDVDVTKDLVRTIPIIDSNGNQFQQHVEFENEPEYCTKRRNIGHYTEHCKNIDSGEEDPVKDAPALPQKQNKREPVVPALPQKQKKSKEAVKHAPALPEKLAILNQFSIGCNSPSSSSAAPAGEAVQIQEKQSSKAEGSSSRTSSDSCNQAVRAEGNSSRRIGKQDESSLQTDETEYVPIAEADQFQMVGKDNRIVKPKIKTGVKLKDQLYSKQIMERPSLGKRAGSKHPS